MIAAAAVNGWVLGLQFWLVAMIYLVIGYVVGRRFRILAESTAALRPGPLLVQYLPETPPSPHTLPSDITTTIRGGRGPLKATTTESLQVLARHPGSRPRTVHVVDGRTLFGCYATVHADSGRILHLEKERSWRPQMVEP